MLTSKQHTRVCKNAFWQVLINCPQDDPDYKTSKRRITQLMSVYFIQEQRLEIELFKQFVDYIDHLCEKSYGRLFKDCSYDIMDDILYLAFQKYLSVDQLLSFYQHIVIEKPISWCVVCRRYSINSEC